MQDPSGEGRSQQEETAMTQVGREHGLKRAGEVMRTVRLESCQRGGLFLASGTHQVSVVKESQAEAAEWMVTPFSKSRDGEGEKKGDEERTVQERG